MKQAVRIAKALANRQRLRILYLLKRGKLCVCQITAVLSLAPSTVSKHLSQLSHAGLVDGYKRGRWVFYGLPASGARSPHGLALVWARRALTDDPHLRVDGKRLTEIKKIPPEAICHKRRAG